MDHFKYTYVIDSLWDDCWNKALEEAEKKMEKEELGDWIKIAQEYDKENRLKIVSNDESVLKKLIEEQVTRFSSRNKSFDIYKSIDEKLKEINNPIYVKKIKDQLFDVVKDIPDLKVKMLQYSKKYDELAKFFERCSTDDLIQHRLTYYLGFFVYAGGGDKKYREFILNMAMKHVKVVLEKCVEQLEDIFGVKNNPKFEEWKKGGFKKKRSGDEECSILELEFSKNHFSREVENRICFGEMEAIEYQICTDKYMDEKEFENPEEAFVPNNYEWVVDFLLIEKKSLRLWLCFMNFVKVVRLVLSKEAFADFYKRFLILPTGKQYLGILCSDLKWVNCSENFYREDTFHLISEFEKYHDNTFLENVEKDHENYLESFNDKFRIQHWKDHA